MFKVFLDKLKRFLCVLMASFMLMSDISGAAIQTVHAAAVAVPTSIALVELLKSLIISAGVTYLGYKSVNAIADSDLYDSLEAAMIADPVIAETLEEARQWQETEGSSALDSGYTYQGNGFRVIGGGSGSDNNVGSALGKMVSITLSAELIRRARDIAKTWADSSSNEFTGAYIDRDLVNGYDITNKRELVYKAYSITDFDSISTIDTFCGSTGIEDFIKEKGYDDSNASVLCHFYSSSYFYFLIVPFEYSYVNNWLLENDFFTIDLLNVYGNAQLVSECYNSLSEESLDVSEYCYKYTYKTKDISSAAFLSYGSTFFEKYVSFNHKTGIEQGSFYRTFTMNDTQILIDDATYSVTDKGLNYDESKADEIPDELTFEIPEEVARSGISEKDLAALLEYVSSLTDWIKDQTQNQEDMLEQSKNILEAINLIRSVLSSSAEDVGDIAATVLSIPALLKKLFGVLPTAVDVTGLADSIPSAIGDEIAGIFPGADTIAGNVAKLPAEFAKALEGVVIEVPEIVIPEIAVPDVDVTLEPTFDITLENDFEGLADAIALKVEGVLTGLFVPDYALTLQKFSVIRGYFGFTDGISAVVGDIFNKLWGITPSPYLKIPLGNETSKYNYGIGEYWIIDVSWYVNYKSYGDKIILAVVWSFFIWNLFLKLPGVISGAEGQMMSGVRSMQKFNNSKK